MSLAPAVRHHVTSYSASKWRIFSTIRSGTTTASRPTDLSRGVVLKMLAGMEGYPDKVGHDLVECLRHMFTGLVWLPHGVNVGQPFSDCSPVVTLQQPLGLRAPPACCPIIGPGV